MPEEKSPTSSPSRRNYQRGANFERLVKKDYETNGWFVVRAAGSHGPADLICLYPAGKFPVELVQCKKDGRISEKDATVLRTIADTHNCIAVLAYWKDGGIVKEVLS